MSSKGSVRLLAKLLAITKVDLLSKPQRIITHWTAGKDTVSGVDLDHYHYMIDGELKIIKGRKSIADNASTQDGVYAAHTKDLNTGSIGITVCGMRDAQPNGDFGDYPMTKDQWVTMADLAAALCLIFDLPITERTVLGHGEVERIYGVRQRGKWDPMVLPWDTGKSMKAVGDMFREEVKRSRAGYL